MNHNTDTELNEYLRSKRLIVFGVGNYFQDFCKRYPEFAESIEFCLDNNCQGELELKSGKKCVIYSPDYIKDNVDVAKHIILFCSTYADDMKQQIDEYLSTEYIYFRYPFYVTLPEQKIYKRIVMPLLEMQEEQEILKSAKVNNWEEFIEKCVNNEIVAIPRLSIVLTSKCSLKCKDCNNLMSYFGNPNDLDSKKIIASIKKIMQSVDVIPCCELIGGEAFLASDFDEILSFLTNQTKVIRVEITTNGTILNRNIDFQNLKNEKVIVKVSDYGKIVNQEKFIKLMRENEVCVEVLKNMMWVDSGSPQNRNRNVMELTKQYDRCYGGMLCKCLWEDKLFGCARAASLAQLGHTKEKQYVNISSSIDLRKDINSFMMLPYYEACDHCDIGLETLKYIQPAIQL